MLSRSRGDDAVGREDVALFYLNSCNCSSVYLREWHKRRTGGRREKCKGGESTVTYNICGSD